MKTSRILVKSNCKSCSSSVAFKLNMPLNNNILALLKDNGFDENTRFTKCNILYVENEGLIATGAFGQNIITTSCKKKDCQDFVNSFEKILNQME